MEEVSAASQVTVVTFWLFFGRQPAKEIQASSAHPIRNCFIGIRLLIQIIAVKDT